MIMSDCFLSGFVFFISTILVAKKVMVQNRNKIESALVSALIVFTAFAAVKGLSPRRTINKRPMSTKSGAPGGCGICTLNALEINSPQSHKLTVASMVIRYTKNEMKKTIH